MIFTKGLLSVAVAVLQLASLSSAGISKRANSAAVEAKYSHDGRTCCTNGETESAFTSGKCEYNSHVLTPSIPEGNHVTKCCWDDNNNGFHVHYAENHQDYQLSPSNITGGASIPTSVCNLGLKWETTQFILTDDYLDFRVNLNADCGPYNQWDEEWLRVYFDSAYRESGKFTYESSSADGPTIYLTATSKINRSDFSIDFHGHITATDSIGNLEDSFDVPFKDDRVAAILSKVDICY
ncbi:hypothetical protein V8C42DRAFT_363513 [Trichoderma barbatum]